jgi:hypothetical protein
MLAGAQRDFLAALLEEAPAPDAGLAIYRRAVFANWHGALAAAYPVTLRLVGAAFFREAAQRFARASASTSGDLNEFGAGFADFLAGYAHAAGLGYLADVARLEWAVHEAHLAADAPACDFDAFARVPAETHDAFRFHFHPAVRLLRSGHAVVALWAANQPARDGTPDRAAGPDCALVRRDEGGVRVELLPPADWEFLEALARGATLGEACALLADADLGRALARLSLPGVLRGFEAPAPA